MIFLNVLYREKMSKHEIVKEVEVDLQEQERGIRTKIPFQPEYYQ